MDSTGQALACEGARFGHGTILGKVHGPVAKAGWDSESRRPQRGLVFSTIATQEENSTQDHRKAGEL